MVRGGKGPDSRYDHGEWVIQEGEDSGVRDSGSARVSDQRKTGTRLLTVLAAAITILLGVIAFADLTVPMLEQRPWVGVSGREEILQGLIAGHTMKVRVTLRNTGRTPAMDLYVAAVLRTGNPPPAPAPEASECAQANLGLPQSVLFPDASYSKTLASQEISEETIAAVMRKEKTVYLVGCAAYDDGIWWWHRQPRSTQFCKRFVPESVGNLGVLGSFEDCPAGNSVD